MNEAREKELLAAILVIVRRYRIDSSLFPELGRRGPYYISNQGVEFEIAMDVIDELIRLDNGESYGRLPGTSPQKVI